MCDMAKVFNSEDVKARKDYICYECGLKIRKGDKYQCNKGLWEGGWDTYRVCMDCANFSAAILGEGFESCDEGGMVFGGLYEAANEYWDCPNFPRSEAPGWYLLEQFDNSVAEIDYAEFSPIHKIIEDMKPKRYYIDADGNKIWKDYSYHLWRESPESRRALKKHRESLKPEFPYLQQAYGGTLWNGG